MKLRFQKLYRRRQTQLAPIAIEEDQRIYWETEGVEICDGSKSLGGGVVFE